MRTILTNEDLKNIATNIFNGNLYLHKANNSIPYENPNSENIEIINEDTGVVEEIDLAEYLNIKFYSWKNRVVEVSDLDITKRLTPFDVWAQSMDMSMNKSFALIETIDDESQASQDIDNASRIARITFLVQTDKIANLDYYVTKIRNSLLGKIQTIQNSYGKLLKAYISLGCLIYDTEPETLQYGSVIQCSCGFDISYMADALCYEDIEVEMSLNGENGTYHKVPITKSTCQLICIGNAEPTVTRPDLTGVVNTTMTWVKTFTFYDFNQEFNKELNKIFWSRGAYKQGNSLDNMISIKYDPNIPVFIRIKTDGRYYLYKDVIGNIEKIVTNGEFTITTLVLKGYGKIG